MTMFCLLFWTVPIYAAGSSFNLNRGSLPLPPIQPQAPRRPRTPTLTRFEARSRPRTPTLTPCQENLRRYEIAIAAEFQALPDGSISVNPRGPGKNIFCICRTETRMTCSILLDSIPLQFIVHTRLDTSNPNHLFPFFYNRRVVSHPENVLYFHPAAGPRILAQVRVYTRSSERMAPQFLLDMQSDYAQNAHTLEAPFPLRMFRPQLRPVGPVRRLSPATHRIVGEPRQPRINRVRSSPELIHYAGTYYISLRTCTEGISGSQCPITHNDFEVGQVVFILKREVAGMADGKPVGCISLEGLLQLRNTQESRRRGGFRDPLRRTGDRLLTIANDFASYTISEDPNQSAMPSEPGPSSDPPPVPEVPADPVLPEQEENVAQAFSIHNSEQYFPWFILILFSSLSCIYLAATSPQHDEAKTSLL